MSCAKPTTDSVRSHPHATVVALLPSRLESDIFEAGFMNSRTRLTGEELSRDSPMFKRLSDMESHLLEFTGPVGFTAAVLTAIQAGAPGWQIKRYATAWCIWKTLHTFIYLIIQEQLMGKKSRFISSLFSSLSPCLSLSLTSLSLSRFLFLEVAGLVSWMRTLTFGFSLGCMGKLLLMVSWALELRGKSA